MPHRLPPEGRLWICTATGMEMEACFPGTGEDMLKPPYWREHDGRVLCVCGIGIPMALGRLLSLGREARPRMILNAGIAGAYGASGMGIGDLVVGRSERYGDIGMEPGERDPFMPVPTEILRQAGDGEGFYSRPMPLQVEPALLAKSPRGREPGVGNGLTVSTCTGTRRTGLMRASLYQADFETMEGAAVAQAGILLGAPVCELRAISNIAAERLMARASIDMALEALSEHLRAVLGGLPC